MHLVFSKELCAACDEKECFSSCPNSLNSQQAFCCIHCNPEIAACAMACKKGAFFEVSKGILSIDVQLCDGCGECTKACEKNTILLEFGKARKCDLCASAGFTIACEKSCQKKSVMAVKPVLELKKAARITGWMVKKIPSAVKLLRQDGSCEIVQTAAGKRRFVLNSVPCLSLQEARLYRKVLDDFQAGAKKDRDMVVFLEKYCLERMISLDECQKKYLLELLQLASFGYGPVSLFLSDDHIEEIAVIGLNKPVYVFDSSYGWLATNLFYCTEKEVKNMVNKMAQKLGRRLTMQTPKLNAVLEDGSRLAAAIEPVSFSGPSITIRKFRQEPFTPVDLVANWTVSSEAMAFLWMAMVVDGSFLISGNTGSGKTSTLNALFCFIPKNERIVSIEETPEIRLMHSHVVRLNVAENLGIGMKQLIVDSLRMRPDRVIVGEIRNNEETIAFIDTLLAGQGKGSYATFHAQSAAETILRLKCIGVNELDIGSIDLIVVQRRWNCIGENGNAREIRRVVEISELENNNGKAELNCLFSFNHQKGVLEKKNESRKLEKKMENCFGTGKKGIQKELKKRQKELEKMLVQKPGITEFFEKINS